MKISLNWLRDYVDLPDTLGIDQIMHDLTMTTVEVEGVKDLGALVDRIVVGRVLSTKPGTENNKVAVTLCDVAGERPLQILCGAQNVCEGMLVPIALPGANIIPHGKQDTVAVKPLEITGTISEAVICAAGELVLGDLFTDQGEQEILDLSNFDCTPGDALAPLIGWDDLIFDIDNKSLTNRPDLWGHYGIARELAAIYQCPLKSLPRTDFRNIPHEALLSELDEPACNRFTATRIQGVQVTAVPFWMRSRLARINQRSINLYVDLTNYVMFATGQPSHVYDAAHLTLPLSARKLRPDEQIVLLDGQEIRGDQATLAIADARQAVAVAGIMGGSESAVSSETSEIILEVANFEAITVRRASTRLGVRSEASSRFEKAIDSQRIDCALALFMSLLGELQPEARATGFHDRNPRPTQSQIIDVTVEFLQERLGKPLSASEMVNAMGLIGFEVEQQEGILHVRVPTWRSTGDISLPHDLIEEVARIHGYDNFAFVSLQATLTNQTIDRAMLVERRFKELLALVGGLQEVISYPWVKDRYLEATGFSTDSAPRIAGAPSPDQETLRPSLIPNLIEMVSRNLHHQAAFEIFESGRVFINQEILTVDSSETGELNHRNHLAAAFAGDDAQSMFLRAKGIIDAVGRSAHVMAFQFSPECFTNWADESGRVSIKTNGKIVGSLGLLTNRAKRIAGIKHAQVVAFELDIDALEPMPSRDNSYVAIPDYPEVDFDLSMVFADEIQWAEIYSTVASCHELIRNVQFVDQYRGKGIDDGNKSITLRLQLSSESRTLQSTEAKDVGSLVAERLREKFSAQVRS